MENKFYTITKLKRQVSKEEFEDFIKNYPRKLKCSYHKSFKSPPKIYYNDYELATDFPFSVIADTWEYTDDVNSEYYIPEENRKYFIAINYEEVFNSKIKCKEVII